MADLSGEYIDNTFPSLLTIGTAGTSGVSGTLQTVTDGVGNDTALQLSGTSGKINGNMDATTYSVGTFGPIISSTGQWLGPTGGISGSSGTSGSSGASGTSGLSGTSGSNGTSGSSGTSGTSFVGFTQDNVVNVSIGANGILTNIPVTGTSGIINFNKTAFGFGEHINAGDIYIISVTGDMFPNSGLTEMGANVVFQELVQPLGSGLNMQYVGVVNIQNDFNDKVQYDLALRNVGNTNFNSPFNFTVAWQIF